MAATTRKVCAVRNCRKPARKGFTTCVKHRSEGRKVAKGATVQVKKGRKTAPKSSASAAKVAKSSAGTSRAATSAHEEGAFRVKFVNSDGDLLPKGPRSRFASLALAKAEATKRNKGAKAGGSRWVAERR